MQQEVSDARLLAAGRDSNYEFPLNTLKAGLWNRIQKAKTHKGYGHGYSQNVMIKTDIETDYIPSAMNATAKNMHLHKWEVIQQDVQNNRSPWHGRMGINGCIIDLQMQN